MRVAIIKYNAGNVQSVTFSLQRLGINPDVTDDPERIKTADKVIFPGVGEASSAMKYLKERNLDDLIKGLQQPTLGICLGLQLMCTYSEEGNTDCMNIFDANVKRFQPVMKVPHMGWNMIEVNENPLFKQLPEDSYLYYVHSYYATVGKETIATTDYINPFSAALHKNNFFAVQAHAEKSGVVGEMMIRNFLAI